MKKYLFVIAIFALYFSAKSQNVGIGTRDPKAALDVSSTTNGFLPPRLTIAQRDSIINPAQGLVIFCTDCDELEVFSGIQWKNIGGSAACIETTLPNIKICNQVWMPTNLATSNYRNGDPIPQVTDPIIWSNINIGAWCWYNNDSATYAKAFGKLYNWYAVNDPRGLAPNGWHIPSDQEYIDLSN